jgi:hypothetical protein
VRGRRACVVLSQLSVCKLRCIAEERGQGRVFRGPATSSYLRGVEKVAVCGMQMWIRKGSELSWWNVAHDQ